MLSYERQRLRELEALRPDFKNADAKYIAPAPLPKRPVYVPKLEDDLRPAPPPIKTQSAPPQQPPLGTAASFRPPHLAPTPPSKSPNPRPASALPPQSPGAGPSAPSTPHFSRSGTPSLPPSSPSAASAGLPFGGKFVDGSKSMFISPSKPGASGSPIPASQVHPPNPLSANPTVSATGHPQTNPTSPLAGKAQGTMQQPYRDLDPLGPLGPTAQVRRTLTSSSFAPPMTQSNSAEDVDPLGLAKPKYMSQSMHLPPRPARPKISAREAASKLANF